MKYLLNISFIIGFFGVLMAQDHLPTDYLSADFHKERREALRAKMADNTVAVFFANPVRNRANDVEYVYHQDPNLYYLTGYKEPHGVLVIFKDMQTNAEGKEFNEVLFVQERNTLWEMWTGRRLGAEGAKLHLKFDMAFDGKEFLNSGINYHKFDAVYFQDFKDDYRDSERNKADLFSLIEAFKTQVGYYIEPSDTNVEEKQPDANKEGTIPTTRAKIDTRSLWTMMGSLREVKTADEMKLLKRAVRISAIGQIEVMKAMKPNMSETEIQGIHEYVYKKYGCEYEGYPSIVGAGHNGCVLHYIENNKTKVEGDLVLMDLGAEYHGYTADVTRTIPANGTYSPEQKAIYDLVYKAQEAGIKATIIGNTLRSPDQVARKIINEGLAELGIINSPKAKHQYFPHGTSHHIGLDVHDLNSGVPLDENMVITVEPGIYIPDGSPCDEKWWGIAVRIEDDILVTKDGPVNLSAEAPRQSDEIEKMMRKKSPLDAFVLPNIDD
ncbi:MAG: aminopeptidase P N-terminal domain-containing protein [bacterium]